jgi:hypothetical protein
MQWRHAEKRDIPEIRRLWATTGYGFPFPDLESEHVISSWVAEEGGCIVCWSGAQLQPEIISIMDPAWGSPHERMRVFGSFHPRVAEDMRDKGHDRAFCTLDPKFPQFGKHLQRLGWSKGWDYWFNLTERVLGKK